jgi:hypothetical protein
MTPPDIITKLRLELDKGITTEAQAVYLLVAVRKLLEQQQLKKQYECLTFYCDWALHSKLTGTAAQKLLKLFEVANIKLRTGLKLQGLPPELRREVNRISRMDPFEEELYQFLRASGLPSLDESRSDGWVHFLHLYARIVQDCPLVMAEKNKAASLATVTLHVELREAPIESDMWFKVTWTLSDRNGRSGEIFVINSFSLNPVIRSPTTLTHLDTQEYDYLDDPDSLDPATDMSFQKDRQGNIGELITWRRQKLKD